MQVQYNYGFGQVSRLLTKMLKRKKPQIAVTISVKQFEKISTLFGTENIHSLLEEIGK